jgi:tetratricopeptide (TPR) repeat protein
MTLEARTPSSSRKKLTQTANRAAVAGTPQSAQNLNGPAFQQYQSACQLMQQNKFEKALVAFEKLLADAPPPLAERSRMYITACHRQLSRSKLTFATPEEQYDYAVSLLNMDYFEEAREQFTEVLRESPDADYAYYGLAVLDAITGQVDQCLDHLSRAIQGNPRHRLQARTDTDFQSMVDDPRFTELLYPEV